MFHYIILVLIRSLFLLFFSGAIITSSISFKFSLGGAFDFTILSAISFPKNSPIASAALCATFLITVFKPSNPAFSAVLNNCIRYLLDKFFPNDKNPYPLTHFVILGSIE